MQNINPARAVSRRGRFYVTLGALAFFAGLMTVALAVLFYFMPLWETAWFSLVRIVMGGAGVVFAVVGAGAVVRGLTFKKDNDLAYAVGEALKQFLDGRYTFLRNVSIRGVGYIDAVLVGPPGALVFRIVDYAGKWRNERANWYVFRRNKMRKARTNPTRECARDVYALRKFLAKRGLGNVPVYGIVVFTSPEVQLSAEDPVIPICELRTLYPIMRRDYLKDTRIAPPTVRQTVDAIIDG